MDLLLLYNKSKYYITCATIQIAILEVSVESEDSVISAGAGDTGLLVLGNTSLEEVGLALQGDELHPVEGVGSIVLLIVAQRQQQTRR